MYIGSTDARGLHHLVWEVVDNSIDEAMAGHATRIEVRILPDATVVVTDDGRGVPVGRHATGKDALEVVHTVLHAGGKFGGGGYKVLGRPPRRRASASSTRSRSGCASRRPATGTSGRRSTSRGKPTTPVTKVGPQGSRHGPGRVPGRSRGVRRRSISASRRSPSACASRPTSTRALWITLLDERADRERSFYFEGGLVSFVRHLNRHKDVLHARPIAVEQRDGATTIEVALQYNDSFTENVFAFANNINTVDGGTHITGFRAALTSSLNDGPGAPACSRTATPTSPATTSAKVSPRWSP